MPNTNIIEKFKLSVQVEREKLGTAEDQNHMFARLAGRVIIYIILHRLNHLKDLVTSIVIALLLFAMFYCILLIFMYCVCGISLLDCCVFSKNE